jgi:lactoylglutathione lyase
MTNEQSPVRELRLAITVKDYDAVVRFYRDVLGLPELEKYGSDEEGHVVVLGAGRATLEILDEKHAAHVDEIEVGRRVAGPVRVALRVEDSVATAERMTEAGADQLAPATVTPWNHRNVRIAAPGDLQLTLFAVLSEDD